MKKISYVLLTIILYAGFGSPAVYAIDIVGESTSTLGIDVRIGFVAEEEDGDELVPDTELPTGNGPIGPGGRPNGELPITGSIRSKLFVFGLLAVAIGWVLALLLKLEKEQSVKVD